MPGSLRNVIAILSSVVLATAGYAQDSSLRSAAQRTTCNACHTCARPTRQNMCLHPCKRELTMTDAMADAIASAGHRAPEGMILLDMLKGTTEGKDLFGPVPFDHAGHAEMAAMGQGCAVCHHHTPEEVTNPACRTCHPLVLRRQNIAQPSLKGAYHRQCMGCHREWAHDTDCNLCHLPRVGETQVVDVSQIRTYMLEKHPPIPEPDVEIYRIGSNPDVGSYALFRHREHTHRYGLKCAECHQGDSCLRCHEEGRKHTQQITSLGESHQACSDCHNVDLEDECGRCHWREGESRPGPFQHASTGWTLNRYHEGKSCRGCHVTVPFVKLERDCNACHGAWSPETFDHAVTGQRLDETHAEFDCEDCHIDRKFDGTPACEECHEEDEGISFPTKRPGAVISLSTDEKDRSPARFPASCRRCLGQSSRIDFWAGKGR